MTIFITGVRQVSESKDTTIVTGTSAAPTEPVVVPVVPTVTEVEKTVVKKTQQVPTAKPVVNNQEEKFLRDMISTYVKLRQIKYPTDRDIQLGIVEFTRIVTYCKTVNRISLFKILFEELFKMHHKTILNPYSMFHALTVVGAEEQKHITVVYEVMMKLREYMTSTKKGEFTMDLTMIENMYPSSNFIQFIKEIVYPR